MIGAPGVALCVLVARMLVAGSAVDLGPARLGPACAVIAAAAGFGLLTRTRAAPFVDALALAVLLPLRGLLCDASWPLLPRGDGSALLVASVSLGPVAFALGRLARRLVGGSPLVLLVGVAAGEVAAQLGAVAWLPGPATGLVAGVVLAVLAALHELASRPAAVEAPAGGTRTGWEGLPIGFALALVALVLRRVLGGYHAPDANPQSGVLLTLLLPAVFVAWPVRVLATPGWPSRVLAAAGALAVGLAILALQPNLAAYAVGPQLAALSRAIHAVALAPLLADWQVWVAAAGVALGVALAPAVGRTPGALAVRGVLGLAAGVAAYRLLDGLVLPEWHVWMLATLGPAAAAFGGALGAPRRRLAGPLLLGVAGGILVHEALVTAPHFSIPSPLADDAVGVVYRGPVTLMLLAAGAAAVAALVALVGVRGLAALLLVPAVALRIHGQDVYPEERVVGFEAIRRVGEFGVEAYGRHHAGDVALFSTPGDTSNAPEAVARYRDTCTAPRTLFTFESYLDDGDAAASQPTAHGGRGEHEDEDEGEPIPWTEREERYLGLRVAGVALHAGHVPSGAGGSLGRLTRLLAAPGAAFCTGIGAELVAAELLDAGLAGRVHVATEAPFEGRVEERLLPKLGLGPIEGAERSARPVDAALRAEPAAWSTVAVAPGRAAWPGTDALLAREHLARLAALLAPGGRCLAWIDTTDLGSRALRARLAAFGAVFGERSAAFVEPRGLDAPFVLLVGWRDEDGAPTRDELARRLPAVDPRGFRTRLLDPDDLAALLLRDGPGLARAAERWPVHRRGRPVPTSALAAGGWASVAEVIDADARLEHVARGAAEAPRWDPALVAGLVAHGRYSFHLERLRTTVVEVVEDVDWDAFDAEWRRYAEASVRVPDHPVLALAVAALLEPLVREEGYTRFGTVFTEVGAASMQSWRLALLEAFVRRELLQPDEAEAAWRRAVELARAQGLEVSAAR